jgi:hypothetical protein
MSNADRWPDFFLVGAMKAGTTSIYNYLGNHPRIFIPETKEPHFFACDTCKGRHFFAGSAIFEEEDYLALFRSARDDQLIGDFSVSNLWCRYAAENIFEKVPSAKIICVLRNPIDRCLSHYVMCVQQRREHRSFKEAIEAELYDGDRSFDYLEAGKYSEQIKRYFKIFSEKNIKICLFDDLLNNRPLFMAEMLRFISVDGVIAEKDMNFSANAGGTPRGGIFSFLYKNRQHYLPLVSKILPKSARVRIRDNIFIKTSRYPKMTEQERALLVSIYERDILSLGNFVGRDLSEWLENRP